jgi:hypothetical protein
MKKKIFLVSMLGLIVIIIFFNSDFGIGVDMSDVKYSVLRFNSGRQIFDDSCGYHQSPGKYFRSRAKAPQQHA